MSAFLPKIQVVLEHFDRWLALYATMTRQQQAIAANSLSSDDAFLHKQMKSAQDVVETRRVRLQEGLARPDVPLFVHQVWSLGGDMAQFDFKLDHLPDFKAFDRASDELSNEALGLTQELSTPQAQADLLAELTATP